VTPVEWVAPVLLSRRDMVAVAVQRGQVRLTDGRLVTLVAWCAGTGRGRRARVRDNQGRTFSVRWAEVEAVALPARCKADPGRL
jgi:hypothetical protein